MSLTAAMVGTSRDRLPTVVDSRAQPGGRLFMLDYLPECAKLRPATARGRAYRGRSAVAAIVACTTLLCADVASAINEARFWISGSNTSTPGPDLEPPILPAINGSTRLLHIWAQPSPGKTLWNFSLNLVSDNPSMVIFSNTPNPIIVHNPTVVVPGPDPDQKRFEFVNDSTATPPLVATGDAIFSPYQVEGIQGFSVRSSIMGSEYTGVGGTCDPGELFCTNAVSPPAFLIASVAVKPLVDEGAAKFYLQIGERGMNHLNDESVVEPSSSTSVLFGPGSAPAYNASTNREVSLDISQAPCVINCPVHFELRAISEDDGDYNGNLKVDAADYVVWRKTLNATGANLKADGDHNLVVNKVDYEVWKYQFGTTVSGGAAAGMSEGIPEPATGVSLLIGIFIYRWRGRTR